MKSSRKRLGIGECPHYETRTINIHKVPFYYPPKLTRDRKNNTFLLD